MIKLIFGLYCIMLTFSLLASEVKIAKRTVYEVRKPDFMTPIQFFETGSLEASSIFL